MKRSALPLTVFTFGLLTAIAVMAADPAPLPMTPLPASDTRFRYEGVFDSSDPAQPVAIWSGSRVKLDFAGDKLVVLFGPAVGQNFFNLAVDGATELVGVPAGPGFRYTWPQPLGAGRHRLELFKRSEAAKGHVAFGGLELAPEAAAWAPASAGYRLKMQFVGDSITAGACNEDGATDQWDTFRTHNYALSWAHLTAVALNADDRAMAYSGMGVITGWEPVKAGEIWDRVYPEPGSRRADLSAWVPDVVFVNLGENDDSYTAAQHHLFPPDFAAGYVKLVQAIRAAYPSAEIILLRGGMHGGKNSVRLREAWDAARQQLGAGDAKMGHYVFDHWSSLHPRVSDDRAMAAELTAWLKQQPFMASFIKP